MSTTAEPIRRTTADPVQRRRALRHLACPVSVLTVSHQGRLHGTTASQVTTVSQRPLIVGASLKAGSVLAELAAGAGRFGINVVGGGQSGTARWFADSSRPDGAAQFAGLDWRPARYSGAPLLDGALAHIDCRVAGRIRVGDHEVLLGRVVHATAGEGEPLLSFAGGLYVGALLPVPVQGPGVSGTRKENVGL
ncbi:flavin reductase family protein [Kitasatospora sp. NPDC101801]|uniref:flavin reductase family protein n=1 Tax=Kitasatospora sp. NPDC101801 TaxID=3364103 RepID=UPI0038218B9B